MDTLKPPTSRNVKLHIETYNKILALGTKERKTTINDIIDKALNLAGPILLKENYEAKKELFV